MFKKTGKIVLLVLMILNGLLFVSNIYVIGNREAAIEMHDDLAPDTSALMANIKVLNCFVVGILYLVAAIGIILKRYSLALAGVVGAVLFIGLYIIQLFMWAAIHPRIWIDFSTFGGVSFVLGIFSWIQSRQTVRRNIPVSVEN